MLAGVSGARTPGQPQAAESARGARLTRRALIGGSALGAASLVLAACSPSPSPGPTDTPSPTDDPDAQVRADVAASEASLIALYDAVIAAHPDLAGDLAVVRDEHAAHLEAMGVAPPPGSTPAVGSRAEALNALSEAEKKAIAQRTTACESSSSADLARVTALIAASEAGHVEYLRGIA